MHRRSPLARRSLIALPVAAMLAGGGLLQAPLAQAAAPQGAPAGVVDPGANLVEFDLPAEVRLPNDIAGSPDGSIWLSMAGESMVMHLDDEAKVIASVPVKSPVSKVQSDREGGVWGLEIAGNAIVHITSDHRVVEYPIPTAFSIPADIDAWGSSVFFTESATGAIGVLTPSTGKIDEYPLAGADSLGSISFDALSIVVADAAAGKLWVVSRDTGVLHECPVPGALDVEVIDNDSEGIVVGVTMADKVISTRCNWAGGTFGTKTLVSDRKDIVASSPWTKRTYFVDAGTNSIGWTGTALGQQEVNLPTADAGARGFARSGDHYIWTIEKKAGKLARLDERVTHITSRVAGADRYETSVEISRPDKPATVFVSSGEKFADALSAGAIAAFNKAPLLLTEAGRLPDSVRERLVEIAPANVIVVGGTASVSASVLSSIRTAVPGSRVERIDGPDRYAVSRAVLQNKLAPTSDTMIYVADGRNFPDGLSSTAAAGKNSAGLLLVDGSKSSLSAEEMAVLSRFSGAGKTVKIVGGPVSVSAGIEAQIKRSGAVVRLGGRDRYEVSLQVSDDAFERNYSTALLANGSSFPDALAGGALGGRIGAPLYLVQQDCVPPGVLQFNDQAYADDITLLGGPSSLSDRVRTLTSC